jgi:hypothetical protein
MLLKTVWAWLANACNPLITELTTDVIQFWMDGKTTCVNTLAKLLNADCICDPMELIADTMPENADCICDPKAWNALDNCENPVVNVYDI